MKRTSKGWKRILLLIFPYIFIVGFFQFIGMIIVGIDFENRTPNSTFSQYKYVA